MSHDRYGEPTRQVAFHLPARVVDWLRAESLRTRQPQKAIVIEALERLRSASDVDGATFDHVR